MSKYPNDDLFESTKMSFGEHLEELRVALFRAVVGLVIGFAIGLMISKDVMNWMQFPLKTALENYYIEKTVDDLHLKYTDGFTPELAAFVRENRLVFDEIYLESGEVRRIGAKLSAEDAAAAATPPTNSPQPAPSAPAAANTADEKPAEKPAETKPAETKLTDSKSAESKSAESKPADAPSDDHPIPTGVSVTAGGLSIHRDEVPPPKSYLVNFRTWRPVKMEVRSLNAQEAFMIWMKAGFISGIVVASPWIFVQVWNFVAAGLYPHEKRYVYLYLPFSLLLFLAGASMAFFFVFEPVLDFLFSFNKKLNIDPDPRISEWLGFVLILPLGFGISFQLPLVMLFIHRIGLVSLQTYIDKWRVAILAIFVISAVLTPADPISIFLMAVPLTLLYFLGMGLCKWMPRVQNPYADAAE
ncbi:MAG: twin-arginine translocase subunit TatC [Pirellulales bacterium]